MYLRGRIIEPKRLSSAVLFVFGLAALAWWGYDAFDGKITVCSGYGLGCRVRAYAGPGDYGFWLTLGLHLGLGVSLAAFGWRGLRERVRDRYR